jgi:phosphatidylserine/phosphatidylglycerophosphate/cardiolipin synthase-like enzyme
VDVRGLVWRSHVDRWRFSAQENRHLGVDIERAGGLCLLDMRVRPGGSHHQKCVVLRHRNRPERDVAFVGGIDLCHSRRDDGAHHGDPQRQGMAAVYGERPPWHDVQVAVRGPAVFDVETVFRERWDDTQPLSHNPVRRWHDRLAGEGRRRPLPPQLRPPGAAGTQAVQLLRTYPPRCMGGYDFAPHGERSVARAYAKVLARARSLVYVEDQFLWSRVVGAVFASALADHPQLRLVAVVPHHPDQDGRLTLPPNLIGRGAALRQLVAAGGDRVAVYGVENHQGTPVYVHAKVCVVDDVWASVGSDNFNRRSWTYDSELAVAVIDGAGDGNAHRFARDLRLALASEHLDREEVQDLADPVAFFDAFRASASRLQRWHDSGRTGRRPPGRLRPYTQDPVRGWWSRGVGEVLYRLVYDPDGRTRADRRAGRL